MENIHSAKEYTSLEKQQEDKILHQETAQIKTQVHAVCYRDISSLKHEDWLYIGVAKGSYTDYDADRLASVLDENQLNYVYEYVGTQELLNQSKQVLDTIDQKSQSQIYDVVTKNINHLESHLYELSQRTSGYNELELQVEEDYQIKSLATQSHYVEFTPQSGEVSIKRKFGTHIDKLEYKPLLSKPIDNTISGISSVGTTNEDDSVSNTTLGMAVAVKDVPSVVENVHSKVISLSVHKNAKNHLKTSFNSGIYSVVESRLLNTKPNLSTSTDTGLDGIKTAVTGVRTAIDTKRVVDNTVVATKKFVKSIKDTPKTVVKDIHSIAEKLKAVVTTVGSSKVGLVVAGVLGIILVVPVLAESTVTAVLTSATSLFGWLQDSDDTSKDYLAVLYDDWEYISKVLTDEQTLYDTTVNTPTEVNSNWKKSFERSDSEKRLYGYQDVTSGEKYNYKEITLNVLSALAIDKYRQLVDGSEEINLEFTDEEIEEKLKLFYQTEYVPTTFYCDSSVLNINNAYDECKQYDYFSNVFNTTSEKLRIYGSAYNTSTNKFWMHIEGESDYRYLNFSPTYYQIWTNQDNFLIHELNGTGYLYGNGTTAYVVGDASFTDGSHVYLVRFTPLDSSNYPSYDDIKAIYTSDNQAFNYGGEIKVLDVQCSGHQEVSCYIATNFKDTITATDLGFTDEEYELFLVVKEELRKLIDEDTV